MPEDSRRRTEVEVLLARAARGDAGAVDRICLRFTPYLTRYVRRRLGERGRRWVEPDDIVQRVLYEATRSLGEDGELLDETGLLRRLHQIANSRIKDSVRNHRREVGESILIGAGPREREADSEGSVTRDDSRTWIRELVSRLPEKYREIVRLVALEEHSYAAVGELLGISPEAVRKRYERARSRLEEKLAENA